MKVVLFGSSGMIGQGVLRECETNPLIASILLINRRKSERLHAKSKEIVHDNFYDFTSIIPQLKEYDTCLFCLGITSVGMSEQEYTKITYDIAFAAANALIQTGTPYSFCYISGAGTDSSEKGNSMWARVKGKTENAILAMPFKNAYVFRPGYIQPLNGIKSKTGWYNAFYTVLKPLYFLLKPIKSFITDTGTMARAMIYAAEYGYPSRVLSSKDINICGKKK